MATGGDTVHRRWEPLAKIKYGLVTHPFSPETDALGASSPSSDSLAPALLASLRESLIALELGDEVYVFEQLGHSDVQWYRGYVVSTSQLPATATSTSSLNDYSSFSGPGLGPSVSTAVVEEPQVYVGIFPSTHVHIREQTDDAEMRLAAIYENARELGLVGAESPLDRSTSLAPMATLPEEDEASAGRINEIGSNGRLVHRPQPPLPSLKCGDETVAGTSEPLVDEIACALREWSTLMYIYLTRRDYSLFHAVKEHIEVLYMARKQLLAQTLSAEEVAKLRRECVARLVKANVAQGLDVIVRHSARGGLVDFNIDSTDPNPDTWVSGVRLFALQAALAYVDQQKDTTASTAPGGIDLAASNAFDITSPTTSSAGVLAGISNKYARRFTLPGRQASLTTPFRDRLGSSHSMTGLLNAASPSSGVKFFHVMLELRAFVATPCSAGETAELYFSLYNRSESRFLTEEFCVVLNHRGVPVNRPQGKLSKSRALFTELSAGDMQDLDVVCRIVRNGGMRIGEIKATPLGAAGQDSNLIDPVDKFSVPSTADTPGFRASRMTGDRSFRRPFGCAVLELGQHHRFQTDISSSSTQQEHSMPIFVPINEAAYSTLHQDIIASRTREFEKSPRADMVAITAKVFHGETASVIRENPSLLQDASITARLGFPDVVFPGDRRNEAYVKLWSGEFFPSGNKLAGSSLKNIQVSTEVRTRDGRVVAGVVSRGVGEALVTQFDSLVYYHQNAPTWGELIKLQLPHDIMEDCHLFFSFRSRSSKEEKAGSGAGAQAQKDSMPTRPFAYAYLPLFESNRAFIPDGSHTLLLWKTSRPPAQIVPSLYFNLPPVTPVGRNISDIVPSNLVSVIQPLRDILTLRTFLVSTKYTQNEVLLKLLNWETCDHDELRSVLTKLTFVSEVEIVKFLRDIFDALFAIATSTRNGIEVLDDLVFNALVTVLGIVQDRRFNNFRATVDIYVEHHFKFTTAHNKLIASMSKLMMVSGSPELSKGLRASIKVWPYLFKFIVQSRENQLGDRELGGGAVHDHLESEFKRELEGLLRGINSLMSATSPSSVIGTQTLALQHFAGILPDITRVFSMDELVRTSTAFVDNVYMTKGKTAIWKLLHILQLTQGLLFDHHSSRSQMIPSVVRWIRPHLGSYDEAAHTVPTSDDATRDAARVMWFEAARLAVTILSVILDRLQVSIATNTGATLTEARQEQDNVDYLLSMMPKLLELYREFSSPAMIRTLERHRAPSTAASTVPVMFPSSYPFPLVAKKPNGTPSAVVGRSSRRAKRANNSEFLNCGLGEISAVVMVLILLSPRQHLASFLEEERDLSGHEGSGQFISNFFEVATSILSNEAYPSTWLNINIFAHQMVLKMADSMATVLIRHFIPTADQSDTFDTALWRSGLTMLLTMLSSEQLVIEQFKPQRRRAVWRLAGDIRGEGAQIFAKLWTSIGWPEKAAESIGAGTKMDLEQMNTGGFQVQFVPSLVEPVLELCLSHHDELRTCAVRVLATMITSEWHLNGDFTVIEAEIIDKLDVLFMTQTKGDEISRAFFIGQLRLLFDNSSVDQGLRDQVHACLLSVNRFLDLLLSVRSLPIEEGYKDDRVAGTLKLLGFLRQANRVSAFSSHVLRLANLHLENLNYVEAALTLKLHADLHSWDMDSVVEPLPDLKLPPQSHFARKETLYMLILDYLGKGQAWEISVDICRELAQQYEFRSVNYARLAEVLSHQANLYQKIATEERTFPGYFRVAYYGQGWPTSLQNRVFVYRGLDKEKFAGFCDRLHAKHPKATLVKTAMSPTDEIRRAEGQFLHATAVQPEPDRSKDVFTNPEVPPIVRAYYENSATDLFSFARPLDKDVDGGNPDQWVEKTYLRCEDAFPTVLRRSEVAEIYVVEISPLENALNDVQSKTEELTSLEKKYAAAVKVGTTSINSNRLSMAINSAVDVPADSGVTLYRKKFLSPEHTNTDSKEESMVKSLREAIDVQASVLYRCIRLHAQICPVEMIAFHENLERLFVQNFVEEMQRLDLDVGSLSSEPATNTSTDVASPERALSKGFRSGMGAIDRAKTNSQRYDEAREDLQDYTHQNESSIRSPLQKHIAYLTRQIDTPKATRSPSASVATPQDTTGLPPITEDMLGGIAEMPNTPRVATLAMETHVRSPSSPKGSSTYDASPSRVSNSAGSGKNRFSRLIGARRK